MIDRRSLIKWSAAAPGIAMGSTIARANPSTNIDALLLDSRYISHTDFDSGNIEKLYFDGDLTSIWYNFLDQKWRKPGFVLGGITGKDALFVLETLATAQGRQVQSRRKINTADQSDQVYSWMIVPVHPSVKG